MNDDPGSEVSVKPTPVNGPNHAIGDCDASDLELIKQWLNGLSPHTQRAYRRSWYLFARFTRKPLSVVTLADMQAFADELQTKQLAPASRNLILSSIKSLYAFAMRAGLLQVDPARPLRLKQSKNTLSERILDEDEVRALIAAETSVRNKVMLRLLYIAGVRVGELVSLRWRDLQAQRGGCGQITVFGKGSKTRAVRLDESMWSALQSLRGGAALTIRCSSAANAGIWMHPKCFGSSSRPRGVPASTNMSVHTG